MTGLGRFYIKAGAFMISISPEFSIRDRRRSYLAPCWCGINRFRGSKRPSVVRGLASMSRSTSPLSSVSDAFWKNHPNPHIRVFYDLALSPGAHSTRRGNRMRTPEKRKSHSDDMALPKLSEAATATGASADVAGIFELDPMCMQTTLRVSSHARKNGSQEFP